MILAALLTASMPAQDPAQLVSKMFGYYYDAKSMSGRIKMTQTINNRSAVIDTTFQYEYPAKIYIEQTMNASYGSDRWLVTGDGVGFTYNPPKFGADTRQNNRLYEPVQYIPAPPKKGEVALPTPPPLDVRGIYGIVGKNIGDRHLPLDVAFGRREDLEFIRRQIVSWQNGGNQAAGGVSCTVVTGRWRDSLQVDSDGKPLDTDNGTYSLWITPEGELKRFERHEMIALRDQGVSGEVVTVWEVNIKKGSIIDPKLFTLVLK